MDRKEAMKWTGDLDFKPGEIKRMATGRFADPEMQAFFDELDAKLEERKAAKKANRIK